MGNNQTNSPKSFENEQDKDSQKLNDSETFLNHFEELAENSANEIEILTKKCIVDLSVKLPLPPVAMYIKQNGQEQILFTKGNFSIITGKAKSRKSFLVSLFMASAIKGSIQDYFYCPNDGVNILFDTEQAEYKVQQVGKRICKLVGTENPKNFISYTLRTLDPKQRLEVIENVLSTTENLNFVAIDGIIDLDIDPILQAEQAQNIVTKLMQWSGKYNVHITCVLHFNKTVSTLLGHLGSIAQRKAESIIEVVKDTDRENVSYVNPLDCREKEFDSFAFTIDENILPRIDNDIELKKPKTSIKPLKQKKEIITPYSYNDEKHERILKEVFKESIELSYSGLFKSIKDALNYVYSEHIGDNKAKDFVTYYNRENKIVSNSVGKKTFYSLSGQKEMEFN